MSHSFSLTVDGVAVQVQGRKPMSAASRRAMEDIVRAARVLENDPDLRREESVMRSIIRRAQGRLPCG